MKTRMWMVAVGVGVIITLVTGVIPTEILMGATHYGFPLSWLTRLVLGPEYDPWRINVTNFIVDTAFWTAISLLTIYLYKRRRI